MISGLLSGSVPATEDLVEVFFGWGEVSWLGEGFWLDGVGVAEAAGPGGGAVLVLGDVPAALVLQPVVVAAFAAEVAQGGGAAVGVVDDVVLVAL